MPELPEPQGALVEIPGAVRVALPADHRGKTLQQNVLAAVAVAVEAKVVAVAVAPVGEHQFLQAPEIPEIPVTLKHTLVSQYHRELLTLLQ